VGGGGFWKVVPKKKRMAENETMFAFFRCPMMKGDALVDDFI
jgi:hypothetical protein